MTAIIPWPIFWVMEIGLIGFVINNILWIIHYRRKRRGPMQQVNTVTIARSDGTTEAHPIMGIPSPDGTTEWFFADGAIVQPGDRFGGFILGPGDSFHANVDISGVPIDELRRYFDMPE